MYRIMMSVHQCKPDSAFHGEDGCRVRHLEEEFTYDEVHPDSTHRKMSEWSTASQKRGYFCTNARTEISALPVGVYDILSKMQGQGQMGQ